jgi:Cupin domain
MKRRVSLLAAVAASMALLALAAFAAITMASPPSGVSPTVLARGTYDAFKVKPDQKGPIDFKAKGPIDMVVRKHDYAPGSYTGWHRHPRPVFVTVTQGQVTFYEYDDPTCTPHVVSAGQGYVDSGRGHIGRNETGQPAQDVSVIITPVGGAFRSELDAQGPSVVSDTARARSHH